MCCNLEGIPNNSSFAPAAILDFLLLCNYGQITTAVELLSGNALDDHASGYFSAMENFERAAQSVGSDLSGGPASIQDSSTVSDTPNLLLVAGS